MKVTRFEPTLDLIIVEGRVWGPRQVQRPLRLVLDTGAAETIVVPEVLDELGYSPRDGEVRTVMRSAVGREEGYLIRVARFACLSVSTQFEGVLSTVNEGVPVPVPAHP